MEVNSYNIDDLIKEYYACQNRANTLDLILQRYDSGMLNFEIKRPDILRSLNFLTNIQLGYLYELCEVEGLTVD